MAEQQPISNIDLAEEASDPSKQNVVNGVNEISDERKEEITKEIEKLQGEIATLKQALQRKEKQLNELRAEIGETRWSRIQNSQAVTKSKQALADVSQKTSQTLKSFGTATVNKWQEIKDSPKVQSASEKFWNATSSVKAKIYGDAKTSDAKEPPAPEVIQPTMEESKK